MIGIVFIIIIAILNDECYIFCYYILDHDDDPIFDLHISYVSFLIIYLTI